MCPRAGKSLVLLLAAILVAVGPTGSSQNDTTGEERVSDSGHAGGSNSTQDQTSDNSTNTLGNRGNEGGEATGIRNLEDNSTAPGGIDNGSSGATGPVGDGIDDLDNAQPLSVATSTQSLSLTTMGEAGFVGSLDDDEWLSDDLTSTYYGSTPLVFATTQTYRGAQEPSQAHVRNVSTSGFETQHCEVESPNGCDLHVAEKNGWIALDQATVDGREGMEAGIISISDEDYQTISFTESFESPPYVFAQVQTVSGIENPRNVQVVRVTQDNFTIQFCEQEVENHCDSAHNSESVSWWAIDPGSASKGGVFDWGTVVVDDSSWQPISYDFSTTPVVLATTLTQNGVHEALYPEVKDGAPDGASVRYCEYNMDDTCDTHAGEAVAWVAVETGSIDYEGPGPFMAGEDGTRDCAGGAGDSGTLITFSGVQGNAPIEVTYKYCYLANSKDSPATIETVFDGAVVDSFQFTTPYTGGDSCERGEPATYAGRSFHVSTGVVDEVRFDYTNGDWRVSIADISVAAEGGNTDFDGDGLQDAEENVMYQTDPFDTDTDDDELRDLTESDQFAHRDIFCGSSCEYPDPISPDMYLEVDGWQHCDSICDPSMMSDAQRDEIEANFSRQGIELHIDNGQLGGGGHLTEELSESFDSQSARHWNLTGLWHVSDDCENPPSIPYHLVFNLDSSCSYSTGARVQGDAEFSVDLTDVTSATLSFEHKWETESTSSNSYDRMWVNVTNDGGTTWDTLRSWDSTDSNQATWTTESVDLTSYAGNVVGVRFAFDSGDEFSNDFAGWFLDNVEVAFTQDQQEWGHLGDQYEDNPNYFDLRRQGVFHQMIWVRSLEGSSGRGQAPGDFGAVDEQCCGLDGEMKVTLEELGHNDFGLIEPSSDQCDAQGIHDIFDDYAIECGYTLKYIDFEEGRWTEYLTTVDSSDSQETGSDSPGDVNNGLQGIWQP